MEAVSYERVVQILQDYLVVEVESCGECSYVRETLEEVCGMTRDEADSLGLGYIFDSADEEAVEEGVAFEKTCGNCVNCVKGEKFWACENYSHSAGMPVRCSPPNDEACENWSSDPNDTDKPVDAMRRFTDSFFETIDDEPDEDYFDENIYDDE